MTILDLSARNWDATPKRRIITTRHRVKHQPDLGARVAGAQSLQSAVYDATLEQLDRHGALPWIAKAGLPSLCKWVTGARKAMAAGRTEWQGVPLSVARGAAQQALLAWTLRDRAEQELAEGWLGEAAAEEAIRRGEALHPLDVPEDARAGRQPSPRLVRKLTREPRACRRRGGRVESLRLAVPCTRAYDRVYDQATRQHLKTRAPNAWNVPGIGRVVVEFGDAIADGADVRSCQLVERTRPGTPVDKRRYRLHIQTGEPAPGGREGIERGLDYGVRHTVTTSDGQHIDRRDPSGLRDEAKALRVRAKTRCKRQSRQHRALLAQARALLARAQRIDEHEDRHIACEVVRGASLVSREDLKLRNMTASGAGTASAPGSGAKHGLNRRMAEQRLGNLDRAIERRCLKTGTHTVAVHPGNTSTTCNACGHKDSKSRRGPDFRCTKCGHTEDADTNAARNTRARGADAFNAWQARRAAGTVAHHGRKSTAPTGQRTRAAHRAPGQARRKVPKSSKQPDNSRAPPGVKLGV